MPDNPNGNHPFFRVLKLPNVSVAAAQRLLSEEVSSDPHDPNPRLQYRQFFIDATKVKHEELASHLADDTRREPFIVLPHTEDNLNAIISERPPLEP